MHNRLRMLSLPVLLGAMVQLCGAAESTNSFAKWEKEIAAFERTDATNPPPHHGWLFTGSSTIRMWKTLAEDFSGHAVINRGFGGSQIADATHFADRIIFPYEPDMVLLRAGGNDLWAGKQVEEVYQDFLGFVERVHERLPKATIAFISLSPSIARWQQADKEKALNKKVQEFIGHKPLLKYIDTWAVPLDEAGQPKPELFLPDKLHFNAAGYKLLAKAVNASLSI